MKARIVSAARDLLQEKKPGRITREEIARRAGVDPGLVRYYFGDKGALITQVILRIADELRGRINTLPQAGAPLDRLREQLRVWLHVFLENPHFHELVVDRVFHGEGPQARQMLASFVERAFPGIDKLVKAGIRKGEIRKVEPRFVYLSMVALCEFYATAGPLVGELFPQGGRKVDDAYARFAAELLVEGLRRRD
jgi:AcrR family transcriptional regulator